MSNQNLQGCQTCDARERSTFCHLGHEQVTALESVGTTFHFEKGEDIPFRRSGLQGFYCLKDGLWSVSLTKSRGSFPLRVVGAGDLVGYIRGIDESKEQRATALSDSVACFYPFEHFHQLAERNPEIQRGIVEMLCRIIQHKDERIVGLEHLSVKNRICAALVIIAGRFGKPNARGTMIPLSIDRKTLAALAGTVPETLSRFLTELEADDLLVRDGRGIVLTREDKLRELAKLAP